MKVSCHLYDRQQQAAVNLDVNLIPTLSSIYLQGFILL